MEGGMIKCENDYNKDVLQRNNRTAKKVAVQNMGRDGERDMGVQKGKSMPRNILQLAREI